MAGPLPSRPLRLTSPDAINPSVPGAMAALQCHHRPRPAASRQATHEGRLCTLPWLGSVRRARAVTRFRPPWRAVWRAISNSRARHFDVRTRALVRAAGARNIPHYRLCDVARFVHLGQGSERSIVRYCVVRRVRSGPGFCLCAAIGLRRARGELGRLRSGARPDAFQAPRCLAGPRPNRPVSPVVENQARAAFCWVVS